MKKNVLERLVLTSALLLSVGTLPVVAQDWSRPLQPAVNKPNSFGPLYGTSDRIFYVLGSSEFTPFNSATTYTHDIGRFPLTGPGSFVATPHLPSGAVLTFLSLDYCDTHATNDVTIAFNECHYSGSPCELPLVLQSSGGAAGCNFVWLDLTGDGIVIDNFNKRYSVSAFVGTSFETQLVGVYIGYKLQVSPAPASATFLDVPTTHPFFRFIEALVDAGITEGCTPAPNPNYCPNAPISRGQMAVFLATALGLHFPD